MLPRAAVVRRTLTACALTTIAALGLAPGASGAGRCGTHPWCDTSLSPDAAGRAAGPGAHARRADRRCWAATWPAASPAAGGHTGEAFGVPRLGLPPLYLTDGPVGVRAGPEHRAAGVDRAGRELRPPPGRARTARVVGNEAKLKGNDVVYAPTVNLLRTPLWGRGVRDLRRGPVPDRAAGRGVDPGRLRRRA